tara:strand:+ start:379 stop:750 length:372 start_codon:yes stop_codon:yes gene_type:complete
MAQVVVALDYSNVENYEFDKSVVKWFSDNQVEVNDDFFKLDKDVLNYNVYKKFNIVIFNFDNLDGDYFSPLFYKYLNLGIGAKQTKKIKISLAEEEEFGFVTLVETTVDKFILMLNNSDVGDE